MQRYCEHNGCISNRSKEDPKLQCEKCFMPFCSKGCKTNASNHVCVDISELDAHLNGWEMPSVAAFPTYNDSKFVTLCGPIKTTPPVNMRYINDGGDNSPSLARDCMTSTKIGGVYDAKTSAYYFINIDDFVRVNYQLGTTRINEIKALHQKKLNEVIPEILNSYVDQFVEYICRKCDDIKFDINMLNIGAVENGAISIEYQLLMTELFEENKTTMSPLYLNKFITSIANKTKRIVKDVTSDSSCPETFKDAQKTFPKLVTMKKRLVLKVEAKYDENKPSLDDYFMIIPQFPFLQYFGVEKKILEIHNETENNMKMEIDSHCFQPHDLKSSFDYFNTNVIKKK
jgi:hypothetical protein